ncbi:MAG TPA: hypothetical protein VD789_03955 [Thermomicrobiales bacterium]|nr:hypothetical protein [Thermomicrobiales bacterium]
MTRILHTLMLALVLLAPLSTAARQDATPTVTTDALTDPEAVVDAVEGASPPAELPGNVDAEISMVTWEEHYDEELVGTLGAWVFSGSPQLPIALLMVFESPESAQAGIAGYVTENNGTTIGELDAWTIADRGKWVCVAADGPVVIFGQAEPQPDESDDDVRRRSCEAVNATHQWLLHQLPQEDSATPGA